MLVITVFQIICNQFDVHEDGKCSLGLWFRSVCAGRKFSRESCEIATLQRKQVRRAYNLCVTAIPGLSFNPLTRNPLDYLGNFRENGFLAKQRDLVLCHDLFNNSVSEYWKHRTPTLPIGEFVAKLIKSGTSQVDAIC